MKHAKISLILLVLLISLVFQSRAEAQFAVPNSVLGNGGALLTGSDNRIVGTIGQPVIGITSNSNNIKALGFWHITGGVVTSVEQISNTIPTEFRLDQNFPNPFNPTTTIRFALPKRSSVTLKLYDIRGREVATLVDDDLPPGEHKVDFNAKGIASGMYLYRLETEGFVQSKKLTLLK